MENIKATEAMKGYEVKIVETEESKIRPEILIYKKEIRKLWKIQDNFLIAKEKQNIDDIGRIYTQYVEQKTLIKKLRSA